MEFVYSNHIEQNIQEVKLNDDSKSTIAKIPLQGDPLVYGLLDPAEPVQILKNFEFSLKIHHLLER
jgi:hypothetical protein